MSMNRMESRCMRCRSWQLLDGDVMVGECRFSPPIIMPSPRGDFIMRVFPPTNGEDWCDQFVAQGRLRIPTEPKRERRARRQAQREEAERQEMEDLLGAGLSVAPHSA